MYITAALWHKHDELIQSFHTATIYGMLNTWRRCEHLTTIPQEPDFVAGLVRCTPLARQKSALDKVESGGLGLALLGALASG